MMGHARSRFSAHLPAKAAVHFRKSPCNSFVRKTLPLTPTHSIVCPAKSLSPRKHGICRMGGGGVTIPSFPIREKKLEHQIPRPPCGGLVMTNLYQEPLRAPTRAAAAHAAVAASVARHDGAADVSSWGRRPCRSALSARRRRGWCPVTAAAYREAVSCRVAGCQ